MSNLQKRLEQLERQRTARQRTRPAAVFLHDDSGKRGWDADDAIDIIIHAGADEPNWDEWELLCVDDGVPTYVLKER